MGVVKKFKSVEDMLDWIYSNYSADELWQSYFLRGVNTDVEEFNEEEFLEARSREIEPEATRILQEEGVEAVKEYMAEQGYEDWWVEDGEVWFSHPGVYADFAADPHLSIEQYPTVVFFKGKYLYYYGDGAIVVPEKVIAIAPKNADPPGGNGVGAAPRIEIIKANKAVKALVYFAVKYAGKLHISSSLIQFASPDFAVVGYTSIHASLTESYVADISGLKPPTVRKMVALRINEDDKTLEILDKNGVIAKLKLEVGSPLDFGNFKVIESAEIYVHDRSGPLDELASMGFHDFDECTMVDFLKARIYAVGMTSEAEFQANELHCRPGNVKASVPSRIFDDVVKSLKSLGAHGVTLRPVGPVERGIASSLWIEVTMNDNSRLVLVVKGGKCYERAVEFAKEEEELQEARAKAERIEKEILPQLEQRLREIERRNEAIRDLSVDHYINLAKKDLEKLNSAIRGIKLGLFGWRRDFEKLDEMVNNLEEDLNNAECSLEKVKNKKRPSVEKPAEEKPTGGLAKPSIDELARKARERIIETLREYYPDNVPFVSVAAIENVIREAGEYPSADLVGEIVRRLEREGLAVREGNSLLLLRFEEDDKISGWDNRKWLRLLAMLAHLITKNAQAGYTERNLEAYLAALKKSYGTLMKEGRRVWPMYEPLDRAILRLVQGVDARWDELLGKRSVRELIEEAERAVRRAEETKRVEERPPAPPKPPEKPKVERKPWWEKYVEHAERIIASVEKLEDLTSEIERRKKVLIGKIRSFIRRIKEGRIDPMKADEMISSFEHEAIRIGDLIRYEKAKRAAEKVGKAEEKPPAPPKPPEKKPAEKPFSELAKKLAIEKLTYFTKARALELGFSVGEANRIVQDLKDELTLLGTAIVTGDTTQEAAEREIEEGLRNLKRKKEEEERRKEEEKERKAPRMSKREALTRIKRDVEIALRDKGYRGVAKALDYIGPELEALAEDVARGQLSVEEAVKRAINLAKQYATPPKPGAPPAAPGVEVRPEGFLSASEVADIIWKEYLGDLFNFGVRYVFENYMRERGMLEQDLGRVVGRLASKLRHLGSEMRKRGEETGIGRYIWVGKALTKYAPEIVQFGLLWAMRKIVPEIWPELRLFRNVVEALKETGIEGSIAKALAGVVYDYLAIPLDKWPEDVRHCYEVFVEASREASQPKRRGGWDLWRLYG